MNLLWLGALKLLFYFLEVKSKSEMIPKMIAILVVEILVIITLIEHLVYGGCSAEPFT